MWSVGSRSPTVTVCRQMASCRGVLLVLRALAGLGPWPLFHAVTRELVDLRDHELAGGVDVELGVDVLQVGADGRFGQRETSAISRRLLPALTNRAILSSCGVR
jgi:hypothetical protein